VARSLGPDNMRKYGTMIGFLSKGLNFITGNMVVLPKTHQISATLLSTFFILDPQRLNENSMIRSTYPLLFILLIIIPSQAQDDLISQKAETYVVEGQGVFSNVSLKKEDF
jgi:hypothetical protein